MSFLYQRLLTYVDNVTRDPKAEEQERKRVKNLKTSQVKANKLIDDEKILIKKAQNKQFPIGPDSILRYSIFPEDAKDILSLLDEATKVVYNARHGEEVDDYIIDNFDDDYENFKINAIINTSVYPKANGGRLGLWMILRGIKQLIHDNDNLSDLEKEVLKTVQDSIKKILSDTKYRKQSDWEPIVQDDLKNIEKYKNLLFSTSANIDKNSDEYKTIISLTPKIYQTVQKLFKNHGEVDFQDKEGDAFTGNISIAKIKEEALKEDKTQDNFSIESLILKTISYVFTVVMSLLFFFILSLGSSMAVNLNVHKPLAYKILYTIYGFLFGFIVIPYVLLYRWWLMGHKPVYYGYLPLIPRFFINPTVQFLLGWLTYKPEKSIESLEEWRHHGTSV